MESGTSVYISGGAERLVQIGRSHKILIILDNVVNATTFDVSKN